MPGLKRQQDRGLDRLELVCRDRGIPVTVQRRVIFSALLERDDHPTVDQIYDDVKGRIPGVSRTTVYRTLEILSDLGLVRRTHHFEAFARFDGNMEHHHHLVCTACSKVVDVDAPGLTVGNLPEIGRSGFTLSDYSIYFEGYCSDCNKNMKSMERRKTNNLATQSRSSR